MIAKIQKWGNSLALRIPAAIAKQIHVQEGDAGRFDVVPAALTINAPFPLFLPPAEERAKVWRYMDFTKFVRIFDQRGVYLSRIDKLDDPFDGSFSPVNQELRENTFISRALLVLPKPSKS